MCSSQLHAAGCRGVLDPKGFRTILAGSGDLIFHRNIKAVRPVIGPLQFNDPLGPGTIEDERHVVVPILEVLDGFQRVHDASQSFMRLRICSHDDRNLYHGRSSGLAVLTREWAVRCAPQDCLAENAK